MLVLCNEKAENAKPDFEHFLANSNVQLNDPFKKKDQQSFQLNDPFKKKGDKPFQLSDPFKKKTDLSTQQNDTLEKNSDKPTETSIKETILEEGPEPIEQKADQQLRQNDPFRKKFLHKSEVSFREGITEKVPEPFSPALVSQAIDEVKFSAEDKGHRVWSIVHETSFARTFTEIAEELDKIIAFSKFILGEDRLN